MADLVAALGLLAARVAREPDLSGGAKEPDADGTDSLDGGKEPDAFYKILLLGDAGVGKSCLLLRFTDNTWTENYISTIGVDFKTRDIEVDGKRIRLQVWDTAGQERFRTITSSYYRGVHGILLCYDPFDKGSEYQKSSYSNLKDVIGGINLFAKERIPVLLVETKSDLEKERVVAAEVAQAYAKEKGMGFISTSAKTSVNVDAAFGMLAAKLEAVKTKDKENDWMSADKARDTWPGPSIRKRLEELFVQPEPTADEKNLVSIQPPSKAGSDPGEILLSRRVAYPATVLDMKKFLYAFSKGTEKEIRTTLLLNGAFPPVKKWNGLSLDTYRALVFHLLYGKYKDIELSKDNMFDLMKILLYTPQPNWEEDPSFLRIYKKLIRGKTASKAISELSRLTIPETHDTIATSLLDVQPSIAPSRVFNISSRYQRKWTKNEVGNINENLLSKGETPCQLYERTAILLAKIMKMKRFNPIRAEKKDLEEEMAWISITPLTLIRLYEQVTYKAAYGTPSELVYGITQEIETWACDGTILAGRSKEYILPLQGGKKPDKARKNYEEKVKRAKLLVRQKYVNRVNAK